MQVGTGTLPRSWTDVLCARTWLDLCAQLSSLTLGMGPRGLGPSKGNGDWTSEPACPSIPTMTQQLSDGRCVGERACAQACVILCNEAKASLLGRWHHVAGWYRDSGHWYSAWQPALMPSQFLPSEPLPSPALPPTCSVSSGKSGQSWGPLVPPTNGVLDS